MSSSNYNNNITCQKLNTSNILYRTIPVKGELMVGNGNNVSFLGIGSDGQYLKANSLMPLGLQWETYSVPNVNNFIDSVCADISVGSSNNKMYWSWGTTSNSSTSNSSDMISQKSDIKIKSLTMRPATDQGLWNPTKVGPSAGNIHFNIRYTSGTTTPNLNTDPYITGSPHFTVSATQINTAGMYGKLVLYPNNPPVTVPGTDTVTGCRWYVEIDATGMTWASGNGQQSWLMNVIFSGTFS